MCVLGRSHQLKSVEICVFLQGLSNLGDEVYPLQSQGAGSTPSLDSSLEKSQPGAGDTKARREGPQGLGA